jgi:hypothetical protein
VGVGTGSEHPPSPPSREEVWEVGVGGWSTSIRGILRRARTARLQAQDDGVKCCVNVRVGGVEWDITKMGGLSA